MPKRNRIRTIVGGPQGEDAELVLKLPTVGEMREHGKVLKSFDRTDPKAEQAAREYLSRYTLSWNWVDDDDTPLDDPHKNPDVFGELLADELKWVGDHLAGVSAKVVEDRKNLGERS